MVTIFGIFLLILPFIILGIVLIIITGVTVFLFSYSMGWLATLIINDVFVNLTVMGVYVVLFDMFGGGPIGLTAILYCYAKIPGW